MQEQSQQLLLRHGLCEQKQFPTTEHHRRMHSQFSTDSSTPYSMQEDQFGDKNILLWLRNLQNPEEKRQITKLTPKYFQVIQFPQVMVVLIADDVPHQTQASENYPGYLLWPESSYLGIMTHFPARLTRKIPRADRFLMESICF